MFLGVDIGNTQIVVGVYDDEILLNSWRFASDIQKTDDEYMVLISQLINFQGIEIKNISEMAIGSVVPALTQNWKSMGRKYFNLEPLVVDYKTYTGMPILLDFPSEAGADRIINSVAAFSMYRSPLIIVDFGTATTFDCVSPAGEYLGGAIAPGIEISRQALFNHAARLSSVPMFRPKRAIGRNTAESLQSGVIWGFAGQVDNIVKRQMKEMSSNVPHLREHIRVIATGGLAPFISQYSDTIEAVDLDLTLKGLRYIYKKNDPKYKKK